MSDAETYNDVRNVPLATRVRGSTNDVAELIELLMKQLAESRAINEAYRGRFGELK